MHKYYRCADNLSVTIRQHNPSEHYQVSANNILQLNDTRLIDFSDSDSESDNNYNSNNHVICNSDPFINLEKTVYDIRIKRICSNTNNTNNTMYTKYDHINNNNRVGNLINDHVNSVPYRTDSKECAVLANGLNTLL